MKPHTSALAPLSGQSGMVAVAMPAGMDQPLPELLFSRWVNWLNGHDLLSLLGGESLWH